MSSTQNLSFVWDFKFLDPLYLHGDQKLVCLQFLWKGVPSTKEHRMCSSENCSCDDISDNKEFTIATLQRVIYIFLSSPHRATQSNMAQQAVEFVRIKNQSGTRNEFFKRRGIRASGRKAQAGPQRIEIEDEYDDIIFGMY